MFRCLALGLLLCLVAPLRAAAEVERDERAVWPRFELGVGIAGAVALESRCQRVESDVVTCTGLSYALLTVTAGLRISPQLSIAAVPAVGIGEQSTVLQLTAEGRWHMLGLRAVDPMFGFDAGVMGFIDHLVPDEVGRAQSLGQYAPTLSAVLGVAWQLTAAFELQLDARMRYIAFTRDDTLAQRVSYGPAWAMGLGVSVNFRW